MLEGRSVKMSQRRSVCVTGAKLIYAVVQLFTNVLELSQTLVFGLLTIDVLLHHLSAIDTQNLHNHVLGHVAICV